MKINWGLGIALFYSLFVVVFVFLTWKSTTYDNSLVDKDYYQKDLAYQKHYDKLVNAKSLDIDLKIIELPQKQEIGFYFPSTLGKASGQIHFFCPSNSAADFKIRVETNTEATQFVPVEGLKKGLWKVKVDWQANGQAFYKEESVVL